MYVLHTVPYYISIGTYMKNLLRNQELLKTASISFMLVTSIVIQGWNLNVKAIFIVMNTTWAVYDFHIFTVI